MSSAVSSPFSSSRGPFKKYVTGLGGGWSSKIVTNCDKGEGVKPKSDVTQGRRQGKVQGGVDKKMPKFAVPKLSCAQKFLDQKY